MFLTTVIGLVLTWIPTIKAWNPWQQRRTDAKILNKHANDTETNGIDKKPMGLIKEKNEGNVARNVAVSL